MAVPVLQAAFIAGEVAPALYGRFDLARNHLALSTGRNGFIGYQGGFYSRAGTAFVGFSKQTGRQYPPRLIPFAFSINQGLALEFGNYYMRVVSNGGFVTEAPYAITGISKANPAVVSYMNLSTAQSATANVGAVSASYARGDTVVPAGGAFATPVQLLVENTTLAKLSLLLGGINYIVGDTITLAGGTGPLAPVLTVLTIGGGGAVATFAISNGGTFTQNGAGAFTQSLTSGVGSGATFNQGIFGPKTLAVNNAGSYTAVPANPANQASTSGVGAGATFNIAWATPGALANGDWLALGAVRGMTEVNGETYVISALTANTFVLNDVYGNPIDSTAFHAWVSGGTAARIYTLTTPYSEQDLAWIKFTQSADDMSICCVNQLSATEYQPQDLARSTDTNWIFSAVVAQPSVQPPAALAGAASSSGSVDYKYVVTAISPADGSESVASPIADIASAVDIASTAGSITLTWDAVNGVNEYNVYKATPAYASAVPPGALYGYAGAAYGTQFVDSNILADLTQVPPTHRNPFAIGQILGVVVTGAGSGSSFTATIHSLTGSGAVLETVTVSSTLVAVIVAQPGENYLPTDTVTFDNGATGTLTVGAQSGTYPSTVTYFQERRAYGNSLNNPDTYWMSQPGAFTNFDSRIPTIDSDAITGSPWSLEVNGIQFMVPTAGGLLVFTGLSNWLLVGVGSFATNVQAITPSSQVATPQPENGCSPTVRPIKINYDVLYVSSKGSFYFDQPYQLYALSEPVDITESSSHLFVGYSILDHAWCQQPYKLVWSVRNDGALLSLTWLKQQQVAGWARHDTQGNFVSTCSITEPPVDAAYFATQRFPGGKSAYMIERMDNRIWDAAEDCWCVDCGLSLPQPTPDTILNVNSAAGLGALTGVTGLIGGAGYSAATYATVADDNGNGPGTGAVPTLTIIGGAVTAVVFAGGNQGSDYVNPALTFVDPENSGSGASASPVLDNSAAFSASAAAFAAGDVGSIIRSGGGIAEITAYIDNMHVTANILSPIVETIPNSDTPAPQPAGNWTLTKPVTVISGLSHLAGATVTGLADGNVIPPTVVAADGTVTLAVPASAVIIGLGFTAQAQSLYLDAGQPSVQGQRKKVAEVVVRMQASRDVQVGTNQPDGATQSPIMLAPPWGDLADVPGDGPNFPAKPYNALATPLRTGDTQKIPVFSGFSSPGQVCLQQQNPLPMEILAIVSDAYSGDVPQTQVPKPQQGGR